MLDNDEAMRVAGLPMLAAVLSSNAFDGLSGSSFWFFSLVFPGRHVCSLLLLHDPLGDLIHPQGFNDCVTANYIHIHVSSSEIRKHLSSHFLDIPAGGVL